MITIFNRRELCTTFNVSRLAKVRDILSTNRIEYKVKTINRNSSSFMSGAARGRTGTFGNNVDYGYEYIVYVNKVDFEKAKALTMV